jgi:short-subunit dehydrogenase
MDMKRRVHEKYGAGVVVIAGALSGLGHSYARYFIMLDYKKVVLIDSDHEKLQAMREHLLKGRHQAEVFVYQFDLTKENGKQAQDDLREYLC